MYSLCSSRKRVIVRARAFPKESSSASLVNQPLVTPPPRPQTPSIYRCTMGPVLYIIIIRWQENIEPLRTLDCIIIFPIFWCPKYCTTNTSQEKFLICPIVCRVPRSLIQTHYFLRLSYLLIYESYTLINLLGYYILH